MRIRDEYLHGSDLIGVVKKIEVTTGTGNNANKSVIKYIKADSEGGIVEVPIGDITGKAATASKLDNTSAIGSKTNPVYFTEKGVPSACIYSLNATVPAGAANQVLYYSATNTLGTQSYTTLTSNLDVFTAATSSTAGKKGLVPAPSANQLGTGNFFLRADGVWTVIESKSAALNGTATSLVTTGEKYNWNSAYNWYNTMTSGDTDGTINKWKEVEAFLANYGDSSTLAAELAKLVTLSTDQTITGVKTFSEVINGSITGNATTATKLQTARAITLTGSIIGSVSFDGISDVSIATTTNHTHSFESLTSKPTTIEGYGITDALKEKYIIWKEDHQRYVILLCKIGTNTTSIQHTINGTFWTSINGALRYQAAYINVHCSDWVSGHNEYYGFTPFGIGTLCRLVTCNYESNTYLAVTFENPQATNIYFSGSYSNILFTPILYYTGNTSTINNSEIYNSISEVTSYNKLAFTTDNVASATKLQTARTIWGQSFDGTKNIDGYIKINIDSSPDDIGDYNGLRMHRSNASDDKYGVALMLSAYQNKGIQIIGGGYGGEIRYYDGTSLSNLTYFSSNGNVGIGTTSPSSKLHVVGDIYTTDGFKKDGSSDDYVLLGGGGHKALTDFSMAHEHPYLPLSGGTLTGSLTLPNINITSTSSVLPSHYYHYLLDNLNIVYEHFGNNTDRNKITYGHFRFFDGNGSYKTLVIGGDGTFAWNANTVLTTANYNSYSPTLTGTGASGTWGINISGNAESANSAGNADTVDGYHATCGNNKPWGTIPVITTGGFMEVGKHFEFHYDNSTGSDYSTALMCTGNYSNVVNLPSESGTLALTSQIPTSLPANGGNADYATSAGSVDWSGVINRPTNISAFTNDVEYLTSTSLNNYVTLNTAQTITGVKTFASNTFILNGVEHSDIKHASQRAYNWGGYGSANTTPNGTGMYSSLDFYWYNDIWGIGNLRTSSATTNGFGIGLKKTDSNNNLYFAPAFRITETESYINNNKVWHTGNLTNVSQLTNDAKYLTSHAYSYGSIDIYDVNGAKKTSNNTVSASVNTETLRLQEGDNIAITATNSGDPGSDIIKIAVTGIESNINQNGYGQLALWYNGASSVSTTLQSSTFNELLTVKAGSGIDFSGLNKTANNDIWTISAIPYNCAITLSNNSSPKSLIKDSWSADKDSVYLTSNGTSGGTYLAAGTYALWIEDRDSASGTPNYYSGTFTCAGNATVGRLDEIALHSSMATSADTNAPTRIFVATLISNSNSNTPGKHVLRFCSLDSKATPHYLTVKVNRII